MKQKPSLPPTRLVLAYVLTAVAGAAALRGTLGPLEES